MSEKRQRDRLIRLAERHPDWVLGFADEVWWSRFVQASLHAWTEADPLCLIIGEPKRGEREPQAVACYGLLQADAERVWVRFVEGRPVSALTIRFLEGGYRGAKEGKRALLLVWDDGC